MLATSHIEFLPVLGDKVKLRSALYDNVAGVVSKKTLERLLADLRIVMTEKFDALKPNLRVDKLDPPKKHLYQANPHYEEGDNNGRTQVVVSQFSHTPFRKYIYLQFCRKTVSSFQPKEKGAENKEAAAVINEIFNKEPDKKKTRTASGKKDKPVKIKYWWQPAVTLHVQSTDDLSPIYGLLGRTAEEIESIRLKDMHKRANWPLVTEQLELGKKRRGSKRTHDGRIACLNLPGDDDLDRRHADDDDDDEEDDVTELGEEVEEEEEETEEEEEEEESDVEMIPSSQVPLASSVAKSTQLGAVPLNQVAFHGFPSDK